jgi:osmotically-inducible protein OsmY
MTRAAWLLLLVPLVLAGCGLAVLGGGAAAVMAVEDRRTTCTMLDDDSIERGLARAVRERYGRNTHVNGTSFNRVVLLTGEVPDENVRAEIEKMTMSIGNVRAVTNELQVTGVSSLGARANDGVITSRVRARLLDADKVNPIHVKVVTEAGVVYLLGLVTEQEADEAVELARTTGGVRKVVKVFEYCTYGDGFCRPYARPAELPQQPEG